MEDAQSSKLVAVISRVLLSEMEDARPSEMVAGLSCAAVSEMEDALFLEMVAAELYSFPLNNSLLYYIF